LIDLRSDTITKPTPAMRKIMAEAQVGDDVYGEDPCVNRLEALAADLTGMETALFAPSGTQSNLLALLSHCDRGDEYIVGQQAHTYKYEGGGAAVLGSIQPQPLEFEPDGTLDLARVAGAIKEDDFHFARTRLLCLENTQGGKVLPMAYLEEAGRFARERKLALHLDGARLFNAAVKLDRPARDIAHPFDSVSICLSKGLGAPVGSLVCGSQALIAKARKWRKMLGGGMRQAGVLAAAGQFALENNIDRLETDHENARLLADSLSRIEGVAVHPDSGITNMVFITLTQKDASLSNFMASRGILVPRGDVLRLVTHLDVTEQDMALVTEAFREYCST